MRKRGKALTVACVAVAAALPIAGSARAAWGPYGNCYLDKTESHHCYAIEQFEMSGYPREYGDGGVIYADTEIMNVPGGEAGNFVSNELWLGFPGEGNYIEAGQLGGNGYDCCSLHPFFASTKSGVQYAYISPGTVPFNHYNYYEIYDPCHCGEWGIWWENIGRVKTDFGYPAWDTELEGGMEGGSNTQPKNWGRDQVASVEPPSDGWTEWLSGYGNHSHVYRSPGQCVVRNEQSPHWGNIAWSTCELNHSRIGLGPALAPQGPQGLSYEAPATPQLSSAEAVRIALGVAGGDGDPNPSETSIASGTSASTQTLLEPGLALDNEQLAPVLASATYLVVMRGHFTERSAFVRPGRAPLQGTVLGLVIDAHTGFVEGRYIGATVPASPRLARVTSRAPATSSQATRARSARRPHHRVVAAVVGQLYAGGARPGRRSSAKPAVGWRVIVRRAGPGESVAPAVIASGVTGRGGWFDIPVAPGSYVVNGTAPDGRLCGGQRVNVGPSRHVYVGLGCSK